jgi:menaquinone-dependent protoporphyrinogen oxidase
MSILITYASAKGSTREIAERMAERLEVFGRPVECLPIKEVRTASLPNYSAIIVGSAIHGTWLLYACRFICSNAAVLREKPVWAFSVGMMAQEADRVNEELEINVWLRKVVPDLRGHKLFQGRFYQQDLGWFLGLVFKLCTAGEKERWWGDKRNWEVIEAWADGVGKEISGRGDQGISFDWDDSSLRG